MLKQIVFVILDKKDTYGVFELEQSWKRRGDKQLIQIY